MYHERNKPLKEMMTEAECLFIIKKLWNHLPSPFTLKWTKKELEIIDSLKKKRYISKTQQTPEGLKVWCSAMFATNEAPPECRHLLVVRTPKIPKKPVKKAVKKVTKKSVKKTKRSK